MLATTQTAHADFDEIVEYMFNCKTFPIMIDVFTHYTIVVNSVSYQSQSPKIRLLTLLVRRIIDKNYYVLAPN